MILSSFSVPVGHQYFLPMLALKWQKYVGYNGRTRSIRSRAGKTWGFHLFKLHGIVWPQSLGVISVISYNVQRHGGIFSPSADVQAAKDRSTNASLPKFLWVAWQKKQELPAQQRVARVRKANHPTVSWDIWSLTNSPHRFIMGWEVVCSSLVVEPSFG